jgi:Restriction endonuclease AspBHI N-terminal/Restriction endonuclease
VLYSELSDQDWPDEFYPESGRFLYYGDNKNPGHELHETRRSGNLILRNAFEDLHHGHRKSIPPFFIFTKGATGRDVIFRGLAVPGAIGIPQTEDLVAIWKTKAGQRFQNYRAIFTILDVPRILRVWLNEIKGGNPLSENAPEPWMKWINGGTYAPLEAKAVTRLRSRAEQLPKDDRSARILALIVSFFKGHPDREYAFERCAGELVRMMDSNVRGIELTRFWRDGGRDGLGKYRIGTPATDILVDFALEAKCKEPSVNHSSGVGETARLISRLRHRQFGVFVTTSCVHEQAYNEIIEDGHPVLIIAGADICSILQRSGFNSEEAVRDWLQVNFSANLH